MTKISNEEALRIAWLSRIALRNDEISRMAKELEEVVTYAQRVGDIAADVAISTQKNMNVFREDVVAPNDSEAIRTQAPEYAERFFVVPAALDMSE